MKPFPVIVIFISVLLLPGCIFGNDLNLYPFMDRTVPLQEFTLQGDGDSKIAIVPVTGILTHKSEETFTGTTPSPVQEVVSRLNVIARDSDVRAVILQIDSPGGSVTASDILYNEVAEFKKRTGVKVVAAMMDLAASGGYYTALAADTIVAHPTTITGSIGVVLLRANVSGLMDKIGAKVEVSKSGDHKDMGSPFREATDEDRKLFQEMIDRLHGRFVKLVAQNRGLTEKRAGEISDGRIYTAEQALRLGLIDRIGYLPDAVAAAKEAAGLPDDARLIVYRRSEHADDNPYNVSAGSGAGSPKLIDLGLDRVLPPVRSGFYYLWLP